MVDWTQEPASFGEGAAKEADATNVSAAVVSIDRMAPRKCMDVSMFSDAGEVGNAIESGRIWLRAGFP